MKIKNIAFFGVMASILSVAGANAAATNQTIIASKNYVDGKIGTINTTLGETYATKEYADTAASNAQSAAISAAATDATNKANAKVSSATTISADSTTTAPNEKAVSTALSAKLDTTTAASTYATQTALTNGLATKQNAITSTNKLPAANVSGLATVATSGSYNDLTNKPTIPAAQVQSDWNATTGMGVILNKPTLGTVAAKAVTTTQRTATTGTNAATDANVPTEKAVATALASKANTSDLNNKQDKLTTAQLAAANSGITADKVSQYDGYANQIAEKQGTLTTAQLAAVNSGITATKVNTYDGYATTINGKVNTAQGSTNKNKILITDNSGNVTTATSIANTQVTGLGSLATKSAVASADITDGTIVNADISGSANIDYQKMAKPTDNINGGTATCSTDAPCVLSYDGQNYVWTNFAY